MTGPTPGTEGTLTGTPVYMAPEQLEGSTDKLTPATDVYALGLILYEMLTGHRPFRSGAVMQVIQDKQHLQIEPPSRVTRGLPPKSDAICMKCLARNLGKRTPTAAMLADELGQWRREASG